MILKELLDLVSKEKRKKERAKSTKRFVLGVGISTAAGVATGMLFAPKSGKETREDLKKKAEHIKDTAVKNAETIKDSAVQIEQEINSVIKDAHLKTEGVKKDIKDGYDEITHDVNKTAENISKEFSNSVK
jgi:gas vesicle protein